jgi:hypothetical protein
VKRTRVHDHAAYRVGLSDVWCSKVSILKGNGILEASERNVTGIAVELPALVFHGA